jgi:hypothetical protein
MNDVKFKQFAAMICKTCGGEKFNFYIGNAIDKTFLMASCCNEACKEQQAYMIQDKDSTVLSIAELFDITGQNYDVLTEEEDKAKIEETSKKLMN